MFKKQVKEIFFISIAGACFIAGSTIQSKSIILAYILYVMGAIVIKAGFELK